ncbi:hypothetical protein D3C87_2156350 [compost metagenome]
MFPTWVGYFAVPFGYGLGTLYALLKFTRFLAGDEIDPAEYDGEHQVERLAND